MTVPASTEPPPARRPFAERGTGFPIVIEGAPGLGESEPTWGPARRVEPEHMPDEQEPEPDADDLAEPQPGVDYDEPF